MIRKPLVSGVYPTMITPFNTDRSIDYGALRSLIEWYSDRGIDGLFAVCQSSAMFELSRRERTQLCSQTVAYSTGRYPVMASGHVADTLADQIDELKAMADAGADALVLVSNRLASFDEPDEVLLKNLDTVISALPDDIPLGVYECPTPYKRLLSTEVLSSMIASGRFEFVKDTCCDTALIEERAALAAGTQLRLFNANAATLLFSLQQGYAGYSGIMTNFHADLYHRICHDWQEMGPDAQTLQDFIGLASIIEYQSYPANAKYALMQEGVLKNTVCRRTDALHSRLTESQMLEIDQFRAVSARMSELFGR